MTVGNSDALSPSPAFGEGLTFIEQLHALSVQLCPNPSVPYITGIKADKAYLMRGTCKSWSCPVCGARNGKKWLARLLNHMNSVTNSGRWYFLTITAHEKMRGKSASLLNIREGWKKLYNRMRRKYGVSEYVKVWEYHKDKSFHLHILIRRKIGKRWLKNNARQCGMGYQVDSSKSKNAGMVAGYIAKYLLKSFEQANEYPKGMRRIEASRNWTKLPEPVSDMESWRISQTRDGQKKTSEELKKQGKQIIDLVPSGEYIEKVIRDYDANKKIELRVPVQG